MSIVNIKDIRTFCGISEADKAEDKVLQLIHNSVESWCKSYCRRDFESTVYKEEYNGTGRERLYLKQYPVTDITSVAMGVQDVMSITNSATAGNATVGVTSTGVVLTKNESAETVLFATYTTLATLEAAINALVTGWTAAITSSSEYSTVKSTALLHMGGRYAMNGTTEYLSIADQPISSYELYANEGILYRAGGWSRGANNIRVDYTAGYSTTTMPDDIQLSIMIATQAMYQRRNEESLGVAQYNLGGMSALFDGTIPSQAREIWDQYKRWRV